MRGSLQRQTSLSLGRLTFDQRLALLREEGVIDGDDLALLERRTLRQWGAELNGLAENVIGAIPIPIGIATHFVVNGERRLIAMATEERSVVGAAAKAAKLCPGGFNVCVTSIDARSRAQIFYGDLDDPRSAYENIRKGLPQITARAQAKLTGMDKYGGGLRTIVPKLLRTPAGRTILVVDLEIDTGEAMGANVVTRMAEAVAEHHLGLCTGKRHTAAICTNRSTGIRVQAMAFWSSMEIPLRKLERTLMVHEWATADYDRAYTHNKGIMNAISAIALATGQDTRAIEASCHSQACESGAYRPLSGFTMTDVEDRPGLSGYLELKLPVGTVGGATSHPIAALCRKIMGVDTSEDLACLMAVAGLAQNFGALRALADEGIPESHRRLAAKDH